MMHHRSLRAAALLCAALSLPSLAPAQTHKELGRMWTFENAPLGWFEQAYGFVPDKDWLDRARLSSLRYGGGCSASFVSPMGLILTNHHCARDGIAAASPEDQDWLTNGYVAQSLMGEVRIPDLTVQQLIATEDVTARVKGGEEGEAIVAEFNKAKPDLQHQLVALYQGGMYQVYSYRIYDDIRLVACPELQAAKFGGDPDNFTYPRFSLDFTLVRAYVDGKPADTAGHYFRWKTAGPKDGETVFVTGNPGSTGRLNTIAQMEFMRDVQYPSTLERIDDLLARERGKGDGANINRVLQLENAQKAYRGYLDGLLNERVMDIKRAAEASIRGKVDADAKLKEQYAGAWTELEALSSEKAKVLSGQAPGGRERMGEIQQAEGALTEKIGEAFFAIYGTTIPPDATFTLRISDGVVKTYAMNGTIAPWFTSLFGLYARHTEFGGNEPFDLTDKWIAARDSLDLTTPFNLVATCDIIGGNSGSPMINKELELVGLVFDGNIEMLANRFVFDDEVARTVCVHPAIIIESLRKVYGAGHVADELEKQAAPKK